ncbi:branched-chain amino acid ABC transporter permease [Pseudoduganella namucuonensis]|uniref:Amino acid/amide ABC transporter membrane protein 1, HAAT family n=1 Tax=Pseudoduganella namucuonensis TaxID=1035707 RepID=A0A1I7LZH0_9BURK|nr:branched-chain amino acid ABC transporter permease [Pseudoduganella namucuonensis]SFV15102.1 amino acid/amide ABC transporter membrane protein 1, HAAT family [Pseudoduganella namucuonensis]
MDLDVMLILLTDGIANGAIYLLAGIGMVLVFSVTRVVFVPFGDVAVFAALSLAAFESGKLPPTVWLVLLLAAIAVGCEAVKLARAGELRKIPAAVLGWGVLPALPCAAAWALVQTHAPAPLQVLGAILLVVPVAPLAARILLQPIADASSLVLLMAALVMHFLLAGLGLMFFGPEGYRTQALVDGALNLGETFSLSMQTLLMVAAAIVLGVMFFLFFERTLLGKALRATAVNRTGARLVGIRPARTALTAYLCASLLAGLIGVLIAPITTLYYDSGFTIGLKAFVAAIIGGLTSYPLTGLGAIAVGVLESFGSFWSGALKDVIVFSMLIPVLMIRSYYAPHSEEEEEEISQ